MVHDRVVITVSVINIIIDIIILIIVLVAILLVMVIVGPPFVVVVVVVVVIPLDWVPRRDDGLLPFGHKIEQIR